MKKVFVACACLHSHDPFFCPCCSFTWHFETNLTDAPVRTILPNFPNPKARVKRTSAPATSSLATWPSPFSTQVFSSRSSMRKLPWTMTRRPSTVQTTVSPTSRKSHARAPDNAGFPQCLKPLFWTLLIAQQAILGENSVHRKLYLLNEYNMELQNLERRNSEYALFGSQRELESQKLHLLVANHWANQSQRERVHLHDELETNDRIHQECNARSCREFEELTRRCDQEETNWKTLKSRKFLIQHDQESRTVSPMRDQVRRSQGILIFVEDSNVFDDLD